MIPVVLALAALLGVAFGADVVYTDDGTGTTRVRALLATDIPSLDASKIATGTFSTGLIPSLDASKVATGTFPASFAPAVNADGLGPLLVVKKLMNAVAVNTDTAIYSANAPFAFTVLDSLVVTTTGQTSGVVTLRDATAGGGNAVSSGMTCAAAGVQRNAMLTAPATINANGTLVARRTGGTGNVTATVVVYLQRN